MSTPTSDDHNILFKITPPDTESDTSKAARGLMILCVVAAFIIIAGFAALKLTSVETPQEKHVQQTLQPDIWTRGDSRTPEDNIQAHFEKHGKEFPFETSQQYAEAARAFVTNLPPGTLMVKQHDGDTVYYNPDLNFFAVTNRRNVLRTFFRPDPKIHGYPSNMAYFKAQEKK